MTHSQTKHSPNPAYQMTLTARASSRPDSNEINQAGSLYNALPALPRLKPVHTEAVTKTSPENGQPKQFDY